MRIVIDGRMISWTGIGRYTSRLIDEIATLDDTTDYVVLLRAADHPRWSAPGLNFSSEVADFAAYDLAQHVLLPRLLRRLEPDLVHFTHFNAPLLYRDDFAVTVYDTTMLRFPSHCDTSAVRSYLRLPKRFLGRQVMANAVHKARTVFTLSNCTASELSDTFKVSSSRIRVTYAAADTSQSLGQPLPELQGPGPFLLYVGNSYPHKNIEVLVAAVEILLGRFPELRLVIAGPEDECSRQLRTRVNAGSARRHVVFAGRVTDDELVWLYRNSTLFVIPSLAEGFGLTGLEAMSYGLPVVAARASCLPEVYAEAAAYFDPRDPGDLAQVISTLLDSDEQRELLKNSGSERSGHFSWESVARETLCAYRQILGS